MPEVSEQAIKTADEAAISNVQQPLSPDSEVLPTENNNDNHNNNKNDDNDGNTSTNYKEIYESLLNQYNTQITESEKLFAQEKTLRKILNNLSRKNSAILDLLAEYEDGMAKSSEDVTSEISQDSNINIKDKPPLQFLEAYSSENAPSVTKKIETIIEKKPELATILQLALDVNSNQETHSKLGKSQEIIKRHEQLFQLYNNIPLLPSDRELICREQNPSSTSSWLKLNYPKIFNDTGDLLNTLRPLPDTSAYILLNSLISLPEGVNAKDPKLNQARKSGEEEKHEEDREAKRQKVE
ncbi:hypothetical protein DASC09_053200 [Saccharomycopsis crataegensis]|uniref:Uncharacterized protein n=1 Tax=Saccharomycopsis crataegensis TaxID=43959 RepID=A0AAV5QTR4_9ASCO|nr:hypothetical protein DASC09_053200 [Saccharomycopsis crataegensis]